MSQFEYKLWWSDLCCPLPYWVSLSRHLTLPDWLWANMTSSKPEVCNISQCCQRTSEPQASYRKLWAWMDDLSDMQVNRHAHCSTAAGGVMIAAQQSHAVSAYLQSMTGCSNKTVLDRGRTDCISLTLDLWPWPSIPCKLWSWPTRNAKVQGQRLIGSKDREETNGRMEAIALPLSLMRSVINWSWWTMSWRFGGLRLISCISRFILFTF